MKHNYIAVGDCLELMKQMPDGCIDMVITSPPYFNLRDYGVSGQIGKENDVDSYIENLIAVFNEVHRILKDDGIGMDLNETYADMAEKRIAEAQ